jgi:hypothetical protein
LQLPGNGTYTTVTTPDKAAEVEMARRYEGSPGRRRRGSRNQPANGSTARGGPAGPWQWSWRRQHRRRRAVGCLLWLATLLLVLLVLSLLFGGFRRGTGAGGGPAHVVASGVSYPDARIGL